MIAPDHPHAHQAHGGSELLVAEFDDGLDLLFHLVRLRGRPTEALHSNMEGSTLLLGLLVKTNVLEWKLTSARARSFTATPRLMPGVNSQRDRGDGTFIQSETKRPAASTVPPASQASSTTLFVLVTKRALPFTERQEKR
jgi:hypothetical protein